MLEGKRPLAAFAFRKFPFSLSLPFVPRGYLFYRFSSDAQQSQHNVEKKVFPPFLTVAELMYRVFNLNL